MMNITNILTNNKVDFVTKEQLGSDFFYRTLIKSVKEAEKFNYHDDYWGDALTYQDDNIELTKEIEDYIGLTVTYESENEIKNFRLLGVLIDNKYNSISHTQLLIEEI